MHQLDALLRRVWLECCGHLSAFKIDGLRYTVMVDPEFPFERNERSMGAKVSQVLIAPGQRFSYEYDFGSTTELVLRLVRTRNGVIGRPTARLLARNEPPVWACGVCDTPAALICPLCRYETYPFFCSSHARKHVCVEEIDLLPVVNSPRMGVCGYTGEV